MSNAQSLTIHIKNTTILHNVGSQLLKADVDSILDIEMYGNHINLIQKDTTISLRHALQMCGVKVTSILKNNILLIENGLTGSHSVYPLDRVFSTTDDLFVTLSLLERIAVARKFIKQYRFGISVKENESSLLSLGGVFSTSLAQTEIKLPFGVVKSIRMNDNDIAKLSSEDPAKPTDAFWGKDTPADSELRNKTFDNVDQMMEYLNSNRIPKPKEAAGGSFPDLEEGDDFTNRSFDQNVDGNKATTSTNMFNMIKLPVTGSEDEAAGDETYALAGDLLPKDAQGNIADVILEEDKILPKVMNRPAMFLSLSNGAAKIRIGDVEHEVTIKENIRGNFIVGGNEIISQATAQDTVSMELSLKATYGGKSKGVINVNFGDIKEAETGEMIENVLIIDLGVKRSFGNLRKLLRQVSQKPLADDLKGDQLNSIPKDIDLSRVPELKPRSKNSQDQLVEAKTLPVHDFAIEDDRVWMYKLGVTTDLKVTRLASGAGFYAFTGDQVAINGLTDEDLKEYSDIINTRYNHNTTTIVELVKIDEKGETVLMVKTGKSVKPNTFLSSRLNSITENQSKE